MLRFLIFILVLLLQSCFLFRPFKKASVTFNENGSEKKYTLVVPKGFRDSEKRVDTSGNQEWYFHYGDGTTLYFVKAADTSISYQPIRYEFNIPKPLNHTMFFKGIDSAGRYWRESRFGNYKSGYWSAESGEDWKYDSAVNYFSLMMKD